MAWCEVGSVTIDHNDQVYVFNRGPHPMMIFDREGNFLRSWGEELFTRAHGAHFGHDGNLYLTDDGNHTVRKCTLDGQVLMTLGIPGKTFTLHESRALFTVVLILLCLLKEIFMYLMVMGMLVSTNSHRMENFYSLGEGLEQIQENLIFPIISAVILMAGSMLLIGKATEFRFLTIKAGMKLSGPTLAVNRDVPNLGPKIMMVDNAGNQLARIEDINGSGNKLG